VDSFDGSEYLPMITPEEDTAGQMTLARQARMAGQSTLARQARMTGKSAFARQAQILLERGLPAKLTARRVRQIKDDSFAGKPRSNKGSARSNS
jgi:hypothetical protein